jgi:hypothetical protein
MQKKTISWSLYPQGLILYFLASGIAGSCNEEIDLTSVQSGSGKLASPGFEAGFYPNNTECSYVIRAGNNSVLEVRQNSFYF